LLLLQTSDDRAFLAFIARKRALYRDFCAFLARKRREHKERINWERERMDDERSSEHDQFADDMADMFNANCEC
jgi:hypothetical protein